MQAEREDISRNIFRILLAQSIFLSIWSLAAQAGAVFVQRFFLGADFRDFYSASKDWIHGINPYVNLSVRLSKPPPTLLVGAAFSWLPLGAATYLFFALNLLIIVVSIRACANRLDLSNQCRSYLTGITLLFYPVYFLVERGNLEGLILGLMCWAFCTRSRTLRAMLVGIAGGLKLYPLLLVGIALRSRQWRFAASTLLAFILLMLPFYRLIGPALQVMASRGAVYQQLENISPAGIICAVLAQGIGRWIYLGFWAGSLVVMLYRQGKLAEDRLILPFLPWMVAFPMLVYPYGGVLLLPVLAWKLREMEGRKAVLSDRIFVNGFLLVGVQAWALTGYFPLLSTYFHLANSLGMLLILGSLAASPSPTGRRDAAAYSVTEDASLIEAGVGEGEPVPFEPVRFEPVRFDTSDLEIAFIPQGLTVEYKPHRQWETTKT